jgi:hypothetical protein
MSKLKTLKDKIKLKTLKDLNLDEQFGKGDPFIMVDDLKQEAIKWYKSGAFVNAESVLLFLNIIEGDLK